MKTHDYHRILGIAGAGQLGLMMLLESRGLPLKFHVYGENPEDPALKFADRSFTGDQYREFVDSCDIVTFEFEHINPDLLKYAEEKNKLRPSYNSVKLKMERHREKEYLRDKGFPVGEFAVAHGSEEALSLALQWKKFVIKTSTGGYDGKGQFYWDHMEDFPKNDEGIFVVEKFVDYLYEASMICARDQEGNMVFYEPSYNYNRKGILINNSTTLKDVMTNDSMKNISQRLLESLGYIGVMGIEFFVTEDGPIINEYAPRVHNTGHHTLMGSSISQFEMHVRAVTGLPLQMPVTYVPSGIVNVNGTELDTAQTMEILCINGTRIYMYGKSPARRKRKMGHVCVTASTAEKLLENQEKIKKIIYGNNLDEFI